jgi:hypothetical protein
MVEIKTTEIKPAQTESSKTAASQESKRNISMVRTALVSARPIAERIRLLVMTVHSPDKTKVTRITEFSE